MSTMNVAFGKEELYDEWVAANQDTVGQAVFRFANRWAALCQARGSTYWESGTETIEKLRQAANDADDESINGYMFEAAKRVLIEVWEDGERISASICLTCQEPVWT